MWMLRKSLRGANTCPKAPKGKTKLPAYGLWSPTLVTFVDFANGRNPLSQALQACSLKPADANCQVLIQKFLFCSWHARLGLAIQFHCARTSLSTMQAQVRKECLGKTLPHAQKSQLAVSHRSASIQQNGGRTKYSAEGAAYEDYLGRGRFRCFFSGSL